MSRNDFYGIDFGSYYFSGGLLERPDIDPTFTFYQDAAHIIMITTSIAPTQNVLSDDVDSAESDGEPSPDTRTPQGQPCKEGANGNAVTLRLPGKQDGYGIHQLISQCPPLDLNSIYTYLLLCEHFSSTCVVAENDGRIDGFVSGYFRPDQPDVLFVWQVAVRKEARGTGLGQRMLSALLDRPGVTTAHYLETTVGPDNAPSRGMFHALAKARGATVTESALFDSGLFGPSGHEDERLIRISLITHKDSKEHTHEH